jgi:dTDP-4-dehydrorhamnose 3,5-epimerase
MEYIKTKIKDCYKLKLNQFADSRGKFIKIYSSHLLTKNKIKVKQINYSTFKKKNILRGFHYQIKPKEELKIVFCTSGKCKIHIIDIRNKSESYKKNLSIELSENSNFAVLIPKGCPNAFQSLKKNSSIIYYSTSEYCPKFEKKINYNSKIVKIKFPKNLILSNKDK